MTRRFTRLAWAAAAATYLLIILGAIVRITGSGMGCGDHWPLCNGRVLPPLDLPTMIEYGHRLAAAAVSVLVVALAAVGWWETNSGGTGEWDVPVKASYVAVGLLIVQIALGAITVKLALPAWTVILHLGTAMALLATLLVAARLTLEVRPTPGPSPGITGPGPTPGLRPGLVAAALGLVTVLLGALTANTGAATACLGFPLCNGEWLPAGNALQHIHWTHRLLAYGLAAYVLVWAWKARARGPRYVLVLVAVQVGVAAAMVLLALPRALQAAHVAVGAAVWAGLVLAAL
jgi:cytochrome c oxidase assembly protein subunit 15